MKIDLISLEWGNLENNQSRGAAPYCPLCRYFGSDYIVKLYTERLMESSICRLLLPLHGIVQGIFFFHLFIGKTALTSIERSKKTLKPLAN